MRSFYVLFVILLFLMLGLNKASANGILPITAYVSGGVEVGQYKVNDAEFKYAISSVDPSAKKGDKTLSIKGSGLGYKLAVGVANNLPIPLVGSLRPQLELQGVSSGDIKGTTIGAGLYYDIIKLLPIVTPYIGISAGHMKGKIKYELPSQDIYDNSKVLIDTIDKQQITKNFNLTMLGFHFGVNIDVPQVSGVSAYVAYGYETSTKKIDDITKPESDETVTAYIIGKKVVRQGAEIGITYSFF